MSSVNRPKGPPIIATSTERAAAGRGVCVNFSTGRLRLRKRKEAWFPNFPSADHSMRMSREVDMDPNTGFDEAIEADIKSAREMSGIVDRGHRILWLLHFKFHASAIEETLPEDRHPPASGDLSCIEQPDRQERGSLQRNP